MKIGTVLLACALLAPGAWAQRGGGGGRGGGMENMGGGGFPRAGNVSRLDMISNMLKLSKDQKKEFKAAMDEAQKEATPVHDQMLKSRNAIAEAIAAGKSQDEMKPLVDQEAGLETQIAAIEVKAFAKVYKTLEPDQRPQATGFLYILKGVFNGKNWNSAD